MNSKQQPYRSRLAVVLGLSTALSLAGCSSQAGNRQTQAVQVESANPQAAAPVRPEQVRLEPPASIAAEHRKLHEQLEQAVGSGGKTGEAAKTVEHLLNVHFEKEEQFALPQLGLLAPLAEGRTAPDMYRAVELSKRLKTDLPKMLEEHKAIAAALKNLKDAAKTENKPDAAEFAENLTAHAENEEQVMYPAAILVGEYLKLRPK